MEQVSKLEKLTHEQTVSLEKCTKMTPEKESICTELREFVETKSAEAE